VTDLGNALQKFMGRAVVGDDEPPSELDDAAWFVPSWSKIGSSATAGLGAEVK